MATFHPFPNLPGELRNAIWELSIHPREVVIKIKPYWKDDDTLKDWPLEFHSSTKPPGTLQACRESRSYISSPRFNYTQAWSIPNSCQYIWVNFDIDTLRVTGQQAGNALEIWKVLNRPCPIPFLTIDRSKPLRRHTYPDVTEDLNRRPLTQISFVPTKSILQAVMQKYSGNLGRPRKCLDQGIFGVRYYEDTD